MSFGSTRQVAVARHTSAAGNWRARCSEPSRCRRHGTQAGSPGSPWQETEPACLRAGRRPQTARHGIRLTMSALLPWAAIGTSHGQALRKELAPQPRTPSGLKSSAHRCLVGCIVVLTAGITCSREAPTRADVKALSDQLRNGGVTVRREAAIALANVKSEDTAAAVAALVNGLHDRDEDVRANAAMALLRLGPVARQALPSLEKMLDDPSQYVIEHVIAALMVIGERDAIPILARALHHEDAIVRRTSATMLAGITSPSRSVAGLLEQALADHDAGVRASAACALGMLGHVAQPAVPALVEAMKDDDENVRMCAVRALGTILQEAGGVLPALAQALTDRSADVAQSAAMVLAETGGRQAVPTLMDALHHEIASVRAKAAWALGKIGPAAIDAIPALEETSKDGDSDVREMSEWAVSRIES